MNHTYRLRMSGATFPSFIISYLIWLVCSIHVLSDSNHNTIALVHTLTYLQGAGAKNGSTFKGVDLSIGYWADYTFFTKRLLNVHCFLVTGAPFHIADWNSNSTAQHGIGCLGS